MNQLSSQRYHEQLK